MKCDFVLGLFAVAIHNMHFHSFKYARYGLKMFPTRKHYRINYKIGQAKRETLILE